MVPSAGKALSVRGHSRNSRHPVEQVEFMAAPVDR
jgi:hypothetical protein